MHATYTTIREYLIYILYELIARTNYEGICVKMIEKLLHFPTRPRFDPGKLICVLFYCNFSFDFL